MQTYFEGIKICGALEKFDDREFTDILKELKKQKFALTLKEQDEWEEYFDSYKQQCNDLSSQIAKTDREIDYMVYNLYGLTDAEIEIVENSR